MSPVCFPYRNLLLRDFDEADRTAFVTYQIDPRYRRLYDFSDDPERANSLFGLFRDWQAANPRTHYQLGIFDRLDGWLLGCGGIRRAPDNRAVLGLELAPDHWGRFRVALDSSTALALFAFERLGATSITGETASGNRRVEKLARWFGADIVACREGPDWMTLRGWQEVEWEITAERWKATRDLRGRLEK